MFRLHWCYAYFVILLIQFCFPVLISITVASQLKLAAYQINICNLSEVKGGNFFIKAAWYYWNIRNNSDELRDLVTGFFCLIADDGISLIKLAESIKQILCSFWNVVFILSSCVLIKIYLLYIWFISPKELHQFLNLKRV